MTEASKPTSVQEALCVRCLTYSTIGSWIRTVGFVCFRCLGASK